MMKNVLLLTAAFAACAVGAVEYQPKDEAALKACLQKLRAGDVVSLVPGKTYFTSMVIRRSGTVTKPIVIRGNGAILDGLKPIPDDSWQDRGNGLFVSTNRVCRGACLPRVCDRNGRLMKVVNIHPSHVKPESLKPGEANWDSTGAWYRVKAGEKSPAGLGLSGYFEDCGIDINNQSYITVENLTTQHFSNDGFNVHGQSQGLVFRNICGRDCGDDGFSVHEDVQAVVYNGHFYGCDDGIQDIQASQTSFFGCLVESNRLWGVGFSGGFRGMYDSVIRNNDGDQLWVGHSHIENPFKFAASVPLIRGSAYFKNLKVEGGRGNALRVDPGSEICCDNCLFARTAVGAEVRKNATLHLSRCRFEGLSGDTYKVDPTGTLVVDGEAMAAAGELPPLITNCEMRVNASLKGKKAFYYCDDVIWLFRDLARQRPKSLFGNPFLKLLKEAHDRYGFKAQLNCFYRTDFFYGRDEFTLAEMPDAYKAEWQANRDWLKLGFHSLQEFPDYPFINADYADMANVWKKISGEVNRFAGDGVFAKGVVCHWGMISKDACKALKDAGATILCTHCGPRQAYLGDPSVLPYGHALRLMQNRKPETCLYRRLSEDKAINSSIGGYNCITYAQAKEIFGNFKYVYDRETGLGLKELEDFQPLAAGINLYTPSTLKAAMKKVLGQEFVVYGNHEQYFYRDYLAYQPDYAKKLLLAAKMLHDAGYEHFFLEELWYNDGQ